MSIFFHNFDCPELQLSEVTTVSCRINPTLALKGLITEAEKGHRKKRKEIAKKESKSRKKKRNREKRM